MRQQGPETVTTWGSSRARRYARFAVSAMGLSLGLCLVGLWPTRRIAGAEGEAAMWVGCGVSLLGSLVGGLILARPFIATPAVFAALAAMAARLGVVVVAAAALLLEGTLSPAPLLTWLAISYGVLLVLDTSFAIEVGSAGAGEGTPETREE